MYNEILNASNKYAEGFEHILKRRSMWLEHYKEIKAHLVDIANYLNENSKYAQGFFVDTNLAYNEQINGTCANLPSLTFRSGEMPMQVTFRNAGGERREYVEEGFALMFTPTVAGQIMVLLMPHYTTMDAEKPQYETVAIVDEPSAITKEMVNTIIAKGIEAAYYTSFTGFTDLQAKEIEEVQVQKQYTPIGFKRHDSTEKVK